MRTSTLCSAEKAEPALFGPQQLSWLERLDAELRQHSRCADLGGRERGGGGRAADRHARSGVTGSCEGRTVRAASAWSCCCPVALARTLCGPGRSAVVASLASPQGDHETVCRLIEASLPVHRGLGDDVVVAVSLALLGLSVLAQGDAERARALTEEGLEVARARAISRRRPCSWRTSASCLPRRGVSTRPSMHSRRAWRAARRLGNIRSVGNWLRALGSISLARRDYAQARLRFEESLAVGRTLGDRWEIAHSLSNLALVALEARNEETARAMLAESIVIEREAGDRLGLAGNLEVFARLAAHRVARHAPAVSTRVQACSASPWASTRSRLVGPIPRRTSPTPCRARRGSVRRGVGPGMRDDVG